VTETLPEFDVLTPPLHCQYANGECDQTFTGEFAPDVFFLYASRPEPVARTIEAAVKTHNDAGAIGDWQTWRALPIAGQMIFCEICKAMRHAKFLVADVTDLNFNLMFEIGFGIGLGKPVIPIRDVSYSSDAAAFSALGMLDTIGYLDYINNEELRSKVTALGEPEPLHAISRSISIESPVYVVKAPLNTDGQIQLMASLKKSALKFRSFDPVEIPRISLHDARLEVAQSVGVVIHLMDPDRDGARVHNARCALIGGLAMAQQKIVVMLQEGVQVQPIDYRDVVVSYNKREDIPRLLDAPFRDIYDRLQSSASRGKADTKSLLEVVDLGDLAAENEIIGLESYFVSTGQANTARQGRARLVVGRKGTGKTAIFYSVRDDVFHRRSHLVLDLKPEGHQFSELKETVISRLGEGLAEHTMVAFWNYILLAELARKIIDDYQYARRDPGRLEAYERVADVYERHNPGFEADFSQRLLWEANRLAERLGETDIAEIGPQLTEVIFSGDVREFNEAVTAYLTEKEAVWLLVDNLDKGWPIRGSTSIDILIVRSLLEATRKLQRQLEEYGVDFRCLVFLRTDIYEHLVELTPDKGKDTAIRLDWDDPELFSEILARRIRVSTELTGSGRELWGRLCVSHIHAEDTFNYLVDRTLMRPRDLLLFARKLVEVAVNRGHTRIETEDIERAERQYSEDIVLNTAYEMADTDPVVAEALYAFQSSGRRLSYADAVGRLIDAGIEPDAADEAVDFLLWFGFLGVEVGDEVLYSHTVQFNIARLRSVSGPGQAPFVVHPAFRAGLGIA
jgi:GTPase SAR1 family protein